MPMDSKTKNIGRFRRFILRLLGPSLSKTFIRRILGKRIDKSHAAFPTDLSRCSDILFILPADKVEMVFQLESLFAVLGKYRDSSITFVCPAAHSSFVNAIKNVRVIKFDPKRFLLYSAEFNRLVKELTVKAFDICIMLEKRYTLAHLYLIGASRAHLRIGWESADMGDSFPFLNIRLVSTQRENVTLWERNREVAKILNAKTDAGVRWGVQKSTAEEVAKVLSEHKLKKEPALICVDLANLENNCGKQWCADLLKGLKESKAGHFYIFGGTEEDNKNFKDVPFPVIPPMSIPRTAALIAATDLVITGAGALLGLAQISSSKIIPVVTKEEAGFYCRQSSRILPALFSDKPDGGTVKDVLKNIKTLMTAPAATTAPTASKASP
jgi:ADP-heptose:LPS heptosyltransferase